VAATDTPAPTNVAVTGAGGYVGRLLVAALAREPAGFGTILATDVRLPPQPSRDPRVTWRVADVRERGLAPLLAEHRIHAVVHLAAIVTPGKGSSRALERAVDVDGTRNVVADCLAAGVRQIVVTSSGAAYGYHPDNPAWLTEDDPIRGNVEFAYSDHKRLVEEHLAAVRREHPELEQLVFRIGTILGAGTRNQITNLFEKRVVVGLCGAVSPFVLVWDEDVVGAILHGLRERRGGVYNLAGDGALTLRELAAALGKPYLPLPPALVGPALAVLSRLGLSRYGPEQVRFLRYRPVLANDRLKGELGYVPRKTSREVFEHYLAHRG
jgi:UDP-glucose 4-epimerase